MQSESGHYLISDTVHTCLTKSSMQKRAFYKPHFQFTQSHIYFYIKISIFCYKFHLYRKQMCWKQDQVKISSFQFWSPPFYLSTIKYVSKLHWRNIISIEHV